MRIGVFKRYWNKFKYNKKRREVLMEMFDASDAQFEFYLQDEYKNWKDEIEGVREFLQQIEKKKLDDTVTVSRLGNTIQRTIKGKTAAETITEIQYSAKTFNPFD